MNIIDPQINAVVIPQPTTKKNVGIQGKDIFSKLIASPSPTMGQQPVINSALPKIKKENLPVGMQLSHLPDLKTPEAKINSHVLSSAGQEKNSFVSKNAATSIRSEHNLSAKEIRKSDIELGAFATYKLSYIDQMSNQLEARISSESNLPDSSVQYEQVLYENESGIVSINGEYQHLDVINHHGLNVYENGAENIERISSVGMQQAPVHYEKYKISILGNDQATVLIRDYGNNIDFNDVDIKNMVSDVSVSKVILNGKEV